MLRESLNDEVEGIRVRKRREAEEERKKLSQYGGSSNANCIPGNRADASSSDGDGSSLAEAVVGTVITVGVAWVTSRVVKWWGAGRSHFAAAKESVVAKIQKAADARRKRRVSADSKAEAEGAKHKGEKDKDESR